MPCTCPPYSLVVGVPQLPYWSEGSPEQLTSVEMKNNDTASRKTIIPGDIDDLLKCVVYQFANTRYAIALHGTIEMSRNSHDFISNRWYISCHGNSSRCSQNANFTAIEKSYFLNRKLHYLQNSFQNNLRRIVQWSTLFHTLSLDATFRVHLPAQSVPAIRFPNGSEQPQMILANKSDEAPKTTLQP